MKQNFKYGDKVKDLSGIEGTVIAAPYSKPGTIRVAFGEDGKSNWRDLRPHQLTLVNEGQQQPVGESHDPVKDSKKWWEALSNDDKMRLSQKHFIGIPLNTLMDKSIEAMYCYEHPLRAKPVQGEGFTQGEWFLSPQKKYVRANGVHGWNIAEIVDQPPYTEANARLIAAAPDMYEALKDLITWQYCYEPRNETEKETFDNCMKQAKAILNRINQK